MEYYIIFYANLQILGLEFGKNRIIVKFLPQVGRLNPFSAHLSVTKMQTGLCGILQELFEHKGLSSTDSPFLHKKYGV